MRAGFGKVEISSSAIGAELVGYADRVGGAVAIHDPLFVRALVIESDTDQVVVCSVDLLYVGTEVVTAARERIERALDIPAERVFISATHTHSAPSDLDADCWSDGLDVQILLAVLEAVGRLEPAHLGAGWGMVHGWSLNRRRFEDPVDPAVFVIRIDNTDGRPLGLYYGFACHAVVLGPDNRRVSGDWPAPCSELIESELGAEAVAMFAQGASGDVNPMTRSIDALLAVGRPFTSQIPGAWYYGRPQCGMHPLDIGDRHGGTFGEARELGHAVAREALRVHGGVTTHASEGLWTHSIPVAQPAVATNIAAPGTSPGGHALPRVAPSEPLEVLLVGLDGAGIVLVGQAGEVFAETGIALRRDLRLAGIRHPFVVGNANGWRGYLPPASAFAQGGYEVEWAQAMGLSESLQDEIRALVLDAVRSRVTSSANSTKEDGWPQSG